MCRYEADADNVLAILALQSLLDERSAVNVIAEVLSCLYYLNSRWNSRSKPFTFCIIIGKCGQPLSDVFDVDVGVKEEHCGFIKISIWYKSKPSAEFIIQALCPMFSPTWPS